jgi:flagellar hook-associated protein 2
MATISSLGIGSGLDIASLVSQLVAAERAPAQGRISTAQSRANLQLSAIGTFKGALSDVKAKLEALQTGALAVLKAQSPKPETFTASTSANAVAGSYDIEVVALAQAHKLASDAYAGGSSSVLGNGDVEISVGGESFTVTLTDGANTLADLRRMINDASDNTGVSATLVNEAGGTRLLLTSTQTGSTQQISVNGAGLNFTELQAATDAHVRVEGFDHYSASNTVADAIDGVTLKLLATDAGTAHRLDIAHDAEAASKAISAFVNSYNGAINVITALTRYDADKRQASPLTGDGTVRGAMQSLRNIMAAGTDGDGLRFLSDIGISTQTDGSLKLDSARLAAALDSDRAGVAAMFKGADSIAGRMIDAITGVVGDDGQVEARTDSLQARLKDLARQQEQLDLRMQRVETRYRSQFTSLDSLIAQMNTTSSFLTQQLANLANLNRPRK